MSALLCMYIQRVRFKFPLYLFTRPIEPCCTLKTLEASVDPSESGAPAKVASKLLRSEQCPNSMSMDRRDFRCLHSFKLKQCREIQKHLAVRRVIGSGNWRGSEQNNCLQSSKCMPPTLIAFDSFSILQISRNVGRWS